MRLDNMKVTKGRTTSILFALSVLLITGVCAYSYVEQNVSFVSIGLLLFAVFLLLLCIVYKVKFAHKASGSGQGNTRWIGVGTFIAVISLSVVFLLGANTYSHHLTYRWDVTQHQQHTLSQATIDFVNGLEKPIELTAFYVGLPPKYLEDLLNEYKRVSNGNITVAIIDPIEDIAYAAKYGNVISGKERKLIVVSGEERKDVDFSDAALSEEQITNALTRVTREARLVYFLTGHGEFSKSNKDNEGLSLFAALLSSNNINSKDLMLGVEQKIPDDCDVLIIAGPRSDLTDQEQGLIQAYLEQGGDALFLIEAMVITEPDVELTAEQKDKNPSLNSILNQWGLSVGSDIVVDLTNHVGGDVGSPATRNYVAHKAITERLDYTFYIRPRSIAVVKDHRPTIKLAPIVLTESKEKSWAETNRTLKVLFDEGIDTPGPVPLSYVVWEEKEQGDESDTRIIAFTDVDFLSNAYLNQYSNAAMGINVVNWLSELDYAVLHDQKNVEVQRLDLTSKQKRMIAALLFLIPLLIAMGGFFSLMRR